MAWWNTREEKPPEEVTPEVDPSLTAYLFKFDINRETAMEIPAFASCVGAIAGTISMLPIKLYKREGDAVVEITDDNRVALLNEDTGDTLHAIQMKYAWVEDMLTGKGGYTYINRTGNFIQSLHYVKNEYVSFLDNNDPIFKDYRIQVNGKLYMPFEFLKVLRATRDGKRGKSVVEQNVLPLSVAYASLKYEENLVRRGGNKKGFLTSPKKLAEEYLKKLKIAWRKLYGNSEESVIVLNDGVEFKESSNTSVEMQLNENKETNAIQICQLFQMSPKIIYGGATEEDTKNYIKFCIMPLLAEIVAGLNRDLLLESEKGDLFFGFDLTEYTKADMKERWQSWAAAKKAGLVQADEFRREEGFPALGMDYVTLGLNDVLYDPTKKILIIPNMGTVIDPDNPSSYNKGGEINGDSDPQ